MVQYCNTIIIIIKWKRRTHPANSHSDLTGKDMRCALPHHCHGEVAAGWRAVSRLQLDNLLPLWLALTTASTALQGIKVTDCYNGVCKDDGAIQYGSRYTHCSVGSSRAITHSRR